MGTTTIQLDKATREKLAGLKAGSRMTYDDLLNKLLALVPEGDDEGAYADAFRVGLLEARLDIKEGRTVSHKDLKKELGLK
jgi:hypothetical protein